jgi:DHA1 family inner membrane transport protein
LLVILAAGVFTTGLNVSVLSPLVESIGSVLGVSDAAVGQLATLHATVAGVVALLIAPWIDRYSRRAVLTVETGILFVATVLSALAPTYGWLMAGRLLAGLGGAILGAMCLAAAGDLFAGQHERNRALAIISASFSISTVVGLPVITQIAHSSSWRWGMAALLIPTALVNVGVRLLPSGPAGPRAERHTSATSLGSYRQALSDWQVNWLLATLIVFCMAMAGWVVYFGAYSTRVFTTGANTLSVLFMLYGIADMVGCSLTPFLLRRFASWTVYRAAALVMAGSLVLAGVVHGAWWMLIPLTILVGISSAALYLLVSVMLLDATVSSRGAVMALQTGCFEFGWAAGAAMSGAILVLSGSYAVVYPLLGCMLAGSLFLLRLSARAMRHVPGVRAGTVSP